MPRGFERNKKRGTMYYFLSIGSNLEPKLNVINIVNALLEISPRLLISRVIETPANGFISNHNFLNACLYVESHLNPVELKHYCNQVESKLGRNRNDPNRATQDHTADIDMIWALEKLKDFPPLPTENYIQPLLLELLAFLGYSINESQPITGIYLELNQQPFGLKPTWIAKELL